MSWWYALPLFVIESDGREEPIVTLVTAFDFGLASAVVERFHKSVEFLSLENPGENFPILSAAEAANLGIILRAPKKHMDSITRFAEEVLAMGIPAAECPRCPTVSEPDAYITAAFDAQKAGAELFCLAFNCEATRLYQEQRDTQGYLMGLLNQVLSLRRLGQSEDAQALLVQVRFEALALEATEILAIISQHFESETEIGPVESPVSRDYRPGSSTGHSKYRVSQVLSEFDKVNERRYTGSGR